MAVLIVRERYTGYNAVVVSRMTYNWVGEDSDMRGGAAMTQDATIMTSRDLAQALDQLDRPRWVRRIAVEEALDSDGEPAFWIWLVLAPEMPDQETAQPILFDLRQRIRGMLSQQAPGMWAYIRIREDGDATQR